jgi:hypothetical protein
MRNGQSDQAPPGEALTCGTCYHFKRDPLDKANLGDAAMACLAHPPSVVLRIVGGGMDGVAQCYPKVGEQTTACGEHMTPEEYAEMRALVGTVQKGRILSA